VERLAETGRPPTRFATRWGAATGPQCKGNGAGKSRRDGWFRELTVRTCQPDADTALRAAK
jgi:hypothetical protein